MSLIRVMKFILPAIKEEVELDKADEVHFAQGKNRK